ncbi:GNAT family N-acetyltransferase [Kitasatospora griseola]|uniref:GNAT family N-acetyltransferase n=1 Tax=Kitasatospora griseola TaxID=2064 RepID=UPI003855DB1C
MGSSHGNTVAVPVWRELPFAWIGVDLMVGESALDVPRTMAGSPDRRTGDVGVRRATSQDALPIARFRAEMIKASPAGPWFENLTVFLAEGLARAEDMAAFVIDGPNGRLVSAALGSIYQAPPGPTYSGRMGYVHLVLTEQAYRRQGLGKAVTTSLLEWFWEEGCGLIGLTSSPDGKRLYRSLGFEDSLRSMRLFGPRAVGEAGRGSMNG